jgi:hypothetical protein
MAIVCSGPPHARLDYGMLGALKPSWAAQVSTYRTNASDTGDLGSGGRLFFDYSYGATQAGATFSGYQTQSVDGGALNLAFGDSVFNGAAETSFSQTDLRALYSNGDTGSPCVGRVWFGALSGASKSEYITTNNAAHVDVVGSTQGSDYIVQCVQAATLHH